MLLGTATWTVGLRERRALVSPLASGRLADLNRLEAVRLAKLGEGDPGRLAEALVPTSLRRLLEAGPRGLARARQTLAYAEKWERRGTLPESLAPEPTQVRLLPCLPRPRALHRADGTSLDRLGVRGPGAVVQGPPQPALAAIGLAGGGAAGFCLALEDGGSAILGAWLVDAWPAESLELRAGAARRTVPLRAWEDLELPTLKAGQVILFPPPSLKPLPDLPPGSALDLRASFEVLRLHCGPEGLLSAVH
jgi:hypothetical protein